jgi:periplasmic divalent cation tolerance protein
MPAGPVEALADEAMGPRARATPKHRCSVLEYATLEQERSPPSEPTKGHAMSKPAQPTRAVVVLVGVPSREEAVTIGRALVEERIAAAANVLPGATSFFWWEGKVQEKGETILLLKTLADNVEATVARVRQLHSYVTPGTIALPILAGDPAWLDWLSTEAVPAGAAGNAATP